MRFADLISLLGLIQGILLSAVILRADKPRRPTLLLGLFILTLSLRILPFLLYRLPLGASFPVVRWLPLYFWYASLPLLYLYIKRLTGRLCWHRDWQHLIPGMVEFLVLSGVLYAEITHEEPLWGSGDVQLFLTLYFLLAIGPALLYGYLILALLKRSHSGITQYYSNLVGKDLVWLKVSVVYLIAFAVLYSFLRFGPVPVSLDAIAIFGAIANTTAVYYLTIHGLRQFALHDTEFLRHEPPPGPKEATPIKEPEEEPALFATVDNYVRRQRPYLDPQLTIADLSEALQISERNLSRIINSGSDHHFNAYINRYRVDYAVALLQDEAYDHYNLAGIADESGFNNKATFYQAFKRCGYESPGMVRKLRSHDSKVI
ncbi:helix-turn-helix domain-containing protein [Lewinella sp. IMCC34191]|uniref:helix-turn-helix domain-containing protein n=1 Tax=Lewinella sp. IMCC34191 TaxID=2259172 RepID=UPI000E28429D|nr:helix-turn-helix domain-containing protein [Lewinella sp. IMCC34191]